MANQLPTGPTKQLARGAGYKVTNYLTLSIALVTLITVAYATSIPQQQQQPQQQRLSLSHASHPHLALKRSAPSAFENFEPLYERPRTYSNAAAIANQRDLAAPADEVQDFDAADEEFLRQLKEAARYLDDKLAERQRQQQQLAILSQAPSFGNRLLESAAGQQQQSASSYGYQEPTYGVLEEQRRPVVDLQTNSPYANSWQTFNEPDSDDETDAGDLEGDETNVVVVAPGHGNSRLISSSPSQVSDYKLLDEQNLQQQQLSNTDAKYKQLLKSLLLDQAQANSLASLSSSENQKRDSIDEPAKRDDDDNDRAGADEEKQQQQSDSTSTSAKYTTLLEDEQDSGKLPATISKDDEAAAKANAPTTASYGTLVYDQSAQRPAVTNSTSPLSSGGSIFGRLYSNVAHYLPFLSQLTSLRLGGTTATNSSTNTNATTTKPAEATAGLNQAGVPTGSGEKKDGQQQTSDNEPLHAKTNVSVSMTLNKSKLEAADHTTTGGGVASGNNGETNKQKQRDNDDDDVDANDDDANQDNQQSQNNDKQRKQGKMNVKVTIDRKKTNNDEEDDNNNIGGNHDDGNLVDDNFTGQFANGDDELGVRHRDTKSGGLKRDQAPQFVFGENDNNNPAELDMNQMVPATIGLGQQGYAVENNSNNDDDAEGEPRDRVTSNRYNMMKHSSLMVPIGEASDVLVRTTSGGASKAPDSLLGKYIYAPTQHYYLNSVMPAVGGGGGFGQHHVLSGNGKHIQPGDDIYGSYGSGHMPMKAAYAYHGDRNSIGGKSSDLYFLVMVGAFCVMAMAVVLAAGMFAYRIQQNRKSSQETDYPTYGVVGPNNMSAKCGAASFVGGYFTGPPSGSSKSGSVKHLPDLYATPNGAGGSDSGLNSLGKSSSNKKASSVSSLNEHNQSTASRAASSNFMAAASQDAARMYHYQHQKQQMIISDRSSGGRQTSASDLDSEDEGDDGSYTVYECPGLASAHEMEIKNPLFNDDQSP